MSVPTNIPERRGTSMIYDHERVARSLYSIRGGETNSLEDAGQTIEMVATLVFR